MTDTEFLERFAQSRSRGIEDLLRQYSPSCAT